MLFGVPQYIDVEDKIAGPLTAKQFLWMLALGAILIVMWNVFNQTAFYAIAVPVSLVFLAFAFYKPQGIPLISFVGYALTFLLQPKIYVWRRIPEKQKVQKHKKSDNFRTQFYKKSSQVNREDLAALADTLDSEGAHQTERMMEIFESQDAMRRGKKSHKIMKK